MSDDSTTHSSAAAEPPSPALPRVSFTEGSIILPAGYEDRSTNLLVPPNTAAQPNLSIARDWMRPNETLPAYVDRQTATLKAQLAGHTVLSREPVHLGVQPSDEGGPVPLQGQRIDAAYRNGKHTIHMRQAAFEVSPLRVLIFCRFRAVVDQLAVQLSAAACSAITAQPPGTSTRPCLKPPVSETLSRTPAPSPAS
jgi:hypothetical protein